MNRAYHRWHSPALQRDMELFVYGHAGARALVFPTSMGRFFEWENRGLVGMLGHQIGNGWLQLYCVDSVDSESWYDNRKHPADRARRHQQYDDYLVREVIPLSQQLNPNPFLISTGASFGGYHAVNFGLKHPELTGRILAMSGICDIRRFCDGYYDSTVYFNNPVDFIAGERDPARIEALKKIDIILAVGRDDRLCDSNRRLSHLLWEKGIWNALRIWDGFAHDWPFWEKMIGLYISGHD